MSVTTMTAKSKRKSSARTVAKEVSPAPAAAAVAAAVFCLERSLEIKDVEEAHRALSAQLCQGSGITVDVSRLATIDTAGVQLLLALQREAARRGVTAEFRGESAALSHALTALGLRGSLHIVAPSD